MDNSRQSTRTSQEIYDFMVGLWIDEQAKIFKRYSTLAEKAKKIYDNPPVSLVGFQSTLWQHCNVLDQSVMHICEEQEKQVSGLQVVIDSYAYGDNSEEMQQARVKFREYIDSQLDLADKIRSITFNLIDRLRQMAILYGTKPDDAQSRR